MYAPRATAVKGRALTGSRLPLAAHRREQAAEELGVSAATIRRWLREGLLGGEQAAPHAPYRIRLDEQVRRRFVPDVPAGHVALAEAARLLGVARQTVLNQVRRGQRGAIHVTQGRRGGLRIEVGPAEGALFSRG